MAPSYINLPAAALSVPDRSWVRPRRDLRTRNRMGRVEQTGHGDGPDRACLDRT
ncbi:MAG: hypothetical protein WBX00_09825 [Isosphaeraceae bacterium]